MAPFGGLFATPKCPPGETERGRSDRYKAYARFGWAADTGVAQGPATKVARQTAQPTLPPDISDMSGEQSGASSARVARCAVRGGRCAGGARSGVGGAPSWVGLVGEGAVDRFAARFEGGFKQGTVRGEAADWRSRAAREDGI